MGDTLPEGSFGEGPCRTQVLAGTPCCCRNFHDVSEMKIPGSRAPWRKGREKGRRLCGPALAGGALTPGETHQTGLPRGVGSEQLSPSRVRSHMGARNLDDV